MGLNTAPDFFQCMLSQLFADLPFVITHINDTAVIVDGNCDNHLQKLDQVLERLQAKGLQVNGLELHWAWDEIKHLGFILTKDGIKPQPKKIKAILAMEAPKMKKMLCQFIGMANHCHFMWHGCSHLLAPLTNSCSKTAHCHWMLEHQKAFKELKKSISSEVILSFPDCTKEFHLHVDASDCQLGAALTQDRKPLAFFSKKLAKHQHKHGIGKKEMLSVVESLQEFHNMIHGCPIVAHMDHKNWTFDDHKQHKNLLHHVMAFVDWRVCTCIEVHWWFWQCCHRCFVTSACWHGRKCQWCIFMWQTVWIANGTHTAAQLWDNFCLAEEGSHCVMACARNTWLIGMSFWWCCSIKMIKHAGWQSCHDAKSERQQVLHFGTQCIVQAPHVLVPCQFGPSRHCSDVWHLVPTLHMACCGKRHCKASQALQAMSVRQAWRLRTWQSPTQGCWTWTLVQLMPWLSRTMEGCCQWQRSSVSFFDHDRSFCILDWDHSHLFQEDGAHQGPCDTRMVAKTPWTCLMHLWSRFRVWRHWFLWLVAMMAHAKCTNYSCKSVSQCNHWTFASNPG